MPDLNIGILPLDPEAEGAGATSHLTNRRGRCVITNLPTVEYGVTVSGNEPDGRDQVLRKFKVRLPAGGRVVRIKLD